MSPADFIILGLLAIALFCALRYIRKHKGGCSGGCGGCPHAGNCHKEEE